MLSDLDLFLAGISSDFFLKETLPLILAWFAVAIFILRDSDF